MKLNASHMKTSALSLSFISSLFADSLKTWTIFALRLFPLLLPGSEGKNSTIKIIGFLEIIIVIII